MVVSEKAGRLGIADPLGGNSNSSLDRRYGTLTRQVRDTLRKGIIAGDLAPGEKLPSEAVLIDRFKVSRTVVREAISELREEGLVEPRRGAGVFILPASQVQLARVNPQRISSVVEGLELRTAIEVEAAFLAAVRSSPLQEERILECFQEVAGCIEKGLPTVDADFAFHKAIAEASNNRRFVDILTSLGSEMIPRRALDLVETPQGAYLERLHEEHRSIVNSLTRRDAIAAREAMRAHLARSQERYRAYLTTSDNIL